MYHRPRHPKNNQQLTKTGIRDIAAQLYNDIHAVTQVTAPINLVARQVAKLHGQTTMWEQDTIHLRHKPHKLLQRRGAHLIRWEYCTAHASLPKPQRPTSYIQQLRGAKLTTVGHLPEPLRAPTKEGQHSTTTHKLRPRRGLLQWCSCRTTPPL